MLGLAVGALVQAPSVDGDDLDEGVLADLREEEGRSTCLSTFAGLLLAEEADCVACKLCDFLMRLHLIFVFLPVKYDKYGTADVNHYKHIYDLNTSVCLSF